MKLISLIPINTKAGLVIAFIVVLLAGYFIYGYYQPECAPCLPGVKCAPCISKTQQVILYFGALLELLLIAKLILVAPATNDDAPINL